ncbi:MAG: hypothetical protein PQJ60_14445 [Spirochaetales bacterium]|nr:hypothetical protein [Spirochaetales bacterium]
MRVGTGHKIGLCFFLLLIGFAIHGESSDEIETLLRENHLYKETMTAQDFNLAGMYFYERQRWYEAVTMFLRATEIDRSHVLAHYNLACVLSLQFNDREANHPGLPGDHDSLPFYFLFQATRLDENRMSRARKDSDFRPIRDYDSDLFDAITLPEDQRERFDNEVVYKGANSFEGDIQLVFTDESGDEIWLSSEYDALGKYPFYSLSGESFIPAAITNEQMVGKKFRILTVFTPHEPELAGDYSLVKKAKVLSLEPMDSGQ